MKTLRKRRIVWIGVGLLVAIVAAGCMLMPDFIGQSKAGKYDPSSAHARPNAVAGLPVAESQTEPHTCGLHAMRSVYEAYGLNADGFRLRFRLGTDQPAMRADTQSAGTLHPDLYRVLAQDGFSSKPIDLEDASAGRVLERHLNADQLALAVVYRSTYHWLVLARGTEPGTLVVIDSLSALPTSVSIDVILDEALSVTLIEPGNSAATVSATEAHADGLAELARLYGRK